MITLRQLEDETIEAIKHQVEIPRGLEEAMATNPPLKASLLPTVLEAVRYSFQEPETAMRVLTAREIKRRVGICLEAMRIMYCEQNLSLHQCYACLRKVLAVSILHASRAEDLAQAQRPGIYGADKPKVDVEVDTTVAPDLAGADSAKVDEEKP